MFRLFKHYVPYPVLLLAVFDCVILFASAELAWVIRAHQIGMAVGSLFDRLPPLISFAIALQLAMIAVGVYGVDSFQSLRFAAARLLVAICLGVIFLSVTYFLIPGKTLWRSNSLYAMAIAFASLVVVRALLGKTLGSGAFKRRVLVLGAGQRANRLNKLAEAKGAAFTVVGNVDMGDVTSVIPTAVPRQFIHNLVEYVGRLGANEVVLALEERRKAIPMDDLLRVRTAGIHVNEISTFLERETGRVDLRSTNPSWLIFSDGFSSGRRLSSFAKRVFDIVASSVLLLACLPLILFTAILVKLDSRGPAFYRQSRVGLYGQEFAIIKLRSMRTDAEIAGQAVWAEENDPRITRVGRIIRRIRVDELPQLWTVLRGGMSFVGPRPERPSFVAELAQKMPYYAERHMVKPGITGWAQINYPYGANLDDARHKLEYDLYYAKNYTPFLDVVILLQTFRVVLFPSGAR
ncbi:MAG: family PEP-CTERM/XrtA system glycosyltransferase [Sphingomonadales bacterium]|jgi:sugar transferase (PEP-CTERM system associated)|nr:family PEP-CTERM/XrtA system glycosyltransferase [Sphingomonadales bacterium]